MKFLLKMFVTIIYVGVSGQYGVLYADVYNFIPNVQVNFVNGPANISQQNRNYSYNTSQLSTPRIQILHEDYQTYHLGDENFRSRKWAPLHGRCYFIKLYGLGEEARYYLSLKRFGTESAAVFINEEPVGYLPPQYRGHRKRPNYWSTQEWIDLPSSLILRGSNLLAICASPVPHPEFPGDVDDFQIRHIKVIAVH